MFLDDLSGLIVLIKFDEHCSELNSIITIFGVFDKNVFNIFFENVE